MPSSYEAACRWCDGAMAFRFRVPCDWRMPDESAPREVHWCAACDYGEVWPRPRADEIAGFYPDNYYTHAEPEQARRPAGFFTKVREHLAWRIERQRADTPAVLGPHMTEDLPRTLCDLGCGNGSKLVPFCADGFEVTGVEPDEQARSVAATKLHELHAGTAENAAEVLAGREFGCVRMSHSLEHCLDPAHALAQAAQLMTPGGVLSLETPNNAARGFGEQAGAWPWSDIPRHLNFFTGKSLSRACEKAGLVVEEVDYRGFARQVREGWLDSEREIDAILRPDGPPAAVRRRAWRTLIASVFASRARKYDSVFLFARKPRASA